MDGATLNKGFMKLGSDKNHGKKKSSLYTHSPVH